MNGRVAVTLKREARKESGLTNGNPLVIYRRTKKAYKTKTYPWQKEPKVNAMQQEANEAMVEMAEKVYGLNGEYPVARRSNLNSRQRRRNLVAKSFNN